MKQLRGRQWAHFPRDRAVLSGRATMRHSSTYLIEIRIRMRPWKIRESHVFPQSRDAIRRPNRGSEPFAMRQSPANAEEPTPYSENPSRQAVCQSEGRRTSRGRFALKEQHWRNHRRSQRTSNASKWLTAAETPLIGETICPGGQEFCHRNECQP